MESGQWREDQAEDEEVVEDEGEEEDELYDLDERSEEGEEEENDYEQDHLENENEEDGDSDSDDDDDDDADETMKGSPHDITRYQKKTTSVLIQKGSLSLTVGEARLYGLVNEKGEIKQKETKKINSKLVTDFLLISCLCSLPNPLPNPLFLILSSLPPRPLLHFFLSPLTIPHPLPIFPHPHS